VGDVAFSLPDARNFVMTNLNSGGNPIAFAALPTVDIIGTISYTQTNGDILLDQILSSGNVLLEATNGSIVDNNDVGGFINNITASTATLVAGGDIGFDDGLGGINRLEIDVDTLEARTTGTDMAEPTSDIYLREADDIFLTDVTTSNGIINIISDNGTISLGNVNAGGGTADVLLAAITGAILDGDAVDTLDIVADTATLTAATGIGTGNALDTTVNSLTAVSTAGGSIDIVETDSILLEFLTTQSGDINVTADGDISVAGVVAGSGLDDVTLISTGAILDGDTGGDTLDIVADTATLTASTGIGTTNRLDLNVSILNANTTSTVPGSDIIAFEQNDIFLNNVSTVNGEVDIIANGTISLGSVDATIINDVTLQSIEGNIVLSGGSGVVTGDTVTLETNVETGIVEDENLDITFNTELIIIDSRTSSGDLESGLTSGSNDTLLEQLTENLGGSEGC